MDTNPLSHLDRSNLSNRFHQSERSARSSARYNQPNHSADTITNRKDGRIPSVPLQLIQSHQPDQNQLNLAASLVGLHAFSLKSSSAL